jgi:hypothetical protein
MNYQTKLKKQYNKLLNLDILSNITDDNLKIVEKLLNSCLPKNTEEKTLYYFIKDLYYTDKEKFSDYIKSTGNIYLCLLTDNKQMMDHFNLNEKVFIGWNNEYKKYFVSKYVKKELIMSSLVEEFYATHTSAEDIVNDIVSYDIVDSIV